MRVFIGCSASNNIPLEYIDDCSVLISELMKDNDLVFGACYSGLMGIAHDKAIENDRYITGICPIAYIDDFKNLDCNEEMIARTVGERTEKLIEQSDALVFLPGGIGTVHEFFTAVECKKCHEFDKPIVLYNSNGFYDGLLSFIGKQYDEKFLRKNELENCLVTNSVEEVVEYIENYKPLDKGVTRIKNK